MVPFKEKFTSPDRRTLSSFESLIGFQLPQDYVDFLLKTGGGVPAQSSYLIEDELREVLVLYGLTNDSNTCLKIHYIDCEGEMPKGYLPIGRDISAEWLCLCLNKSYLGQVFITLDYADGGGAEFLYVAPSFSAFLDSLFGEIEEVEVDPIDNLAMNGGVGELQRFLAEGFSVDHKDKRGRTLIQSASGKGNLALVEELLKRNANPSEVVHYAMYNAQWTVVRRLAEMGVNLNEINESGERPLDLLYGIYGDERKRLLEFLQAHGAVGGE